MSVLFDFTRFETLRKKYGITKTYLANLIGRTPTTIQDWKQKKSEPNDEQIKIIAKALHTTVAYLRGKTNDPNEKPAPMIEDGFAEKISRLPPALAELSIRFLALAEANPDSALRHLSFAVQELEIEQRAR